MRAEYLTAPTLAARHGFFTRRGGVSAGAYASLNCSLSSADAAASVRQNRALVAETMGVAPDRMLGLTQVHGIRVATVSEPWAAGAGPDADAMVTREQGIALGIITADCAPVLFHDSSHGVIAAAHAGWRGAASGILDAVMRAMVGLGAHPNNIHAAVGPCIAQASYEVGADLRSIVLHATPWADAHFQPGQCPEHWQFDLAGYCVDRLRRSGVDAESLGIDTFADEARFYSHRRRTLRGEGNIGHQISVIVL